MSRGFTLIEVLFAMMVTTIALVAIAQLAVIATRANRGAISSSMMVVLAAQKLEQLRSLSWTFDTAGQVLSDTTTDTTSAGVTGAGTGLTLSGNTLAANSEGFCDFLDDRGRSRGGGTTLPNGTAFVRRWSIDALPFSNDTILIQVVVMRPGEPGASVRLASIRTRKGL
jgi:prepilin-type N-terminal cleavage/methylation domain-containing protein